MGRQKRSENTYQKINTIFKRDINGIIMPFDEFVLPELEWLRNCKFDAEEKIDGTNIRIEVTPTIIYADDIDNEEENKNWPLYVNWSVEYKGKTDKAQMQKELGEYLAVTYPTEKVLNALGLKGRMYLSDYMVDKVDNIHWLKTAHSDAYNNKWVVLDNNGNPTTELDISRMPRKYTIYGEGYGRKIQTAGGNYNSSGVGFIGFDVKVDETYLLKSNRDDIFNKMCCPIVPYIGQFTIDEAIDYVKKGFISNISENREFIAEGLVLRSPYGIKDRNGNRIIFKVKYNDWLKYQRQYRTLDKVEQIPNEHY